MQLVGAGLRSARQDEPNHQKFSANSYARTHLTVGVDAYIQDIIKGLIIVVAVVIDQYRNKRKLKR